MSDEEREQQLESDRRMFAEQIIAGEYKTVTVSIMDEDDRVFNFFDGGAITALGMVESMKIDLVARIKSPE